MLGKAIGLFGGKIGFFAMLSTVLIIAGLIGYIKYTDAQRDLIEERLNNRVSMEDAVEARDRVIVALEKEKIDFEAKVKKLTEANEILQRKLTESQRQRKRDYERMTRPRPKNGEPADTAELEKAANEGMNGIFRELREASEKWFNIEEIAG
jgi:hypothetical protein